MTTRAALKKLGYYDEVVAQMEKSKGFDPISSKDRLDSLLKGGYGVASLFVWRDSDKGHDYWNEVEKEVLHQKNL